MVGRPSRKSESDQEAHPKVQVWSGGPPGGPGVVRSPYRRSGSGQEAFLVVREW